MDPFSQFGPALLIGAGIGVGVFVATVVFVWLTRSLATPAAWLSPRPLRGALARVVVVVPAGGVGRVAYSSAGKRCSMAARSDERLALASGAEVVVVEVSRGVATVAPLH